MDGNALTGVFWGLLLGVLFLLPWVTPRGAPRPGCAGLARTGLDDGFLDRVRCSVRPGTSALFIVSPAGALDAIEDQLYSPAVTRLAAGLSPEQAALLWWAFAVDDHDLPDLHPSGPRGAGAGCDDG